MSLSHVIKPQAGWYRGDFHAHSSISSDGYHSPSDLVDVARADGLDFFTITDHNAIDALPLIDPRGDILIIPGMEVTLDEGHFNVFGITGHSSWMEPICTGQSQIRLQDRHRTTTDVMQQVVTEGLLNSINHPLLSQWQWLDQATDLHQLHCLEIWNDPGFPDNRQANPGAVAMWTAWLNDGYRITAIGGSDYHRPDNQPAQRLGLPSTYVYATELSATAILTGLRQHRAYVSMGPHVTFQACANGRVYPIGDDVGELSGEVELTATVSNCPVPARVRIVKNGIAVTDISSEDEHAQVRTIDRATPSQSAWYRLDVLDQAEQFLAMTNPIFVGPTLKPTYHAFGDFF